ncbi:hypothetical protein VCB98_02360 [Gammaproteobacteria bacterium AB-CW1]|uniref:DUF2232 domain-containing protein n=1 Tax=Natronospira elongata TaxID=3110268 RepID=A0AAP6MJT9_9GAMM|nr:hypothetical protein [Gammaproteobacteria bacterium AB-CW1]
MQAVLGWIMSSRWRAVIGVWLMGAIQWLSLLGGGLVALVALRQGPAEGAGVAFLAALGLIPFAIMLGAPPWVLPVAALSLWLPVLVMAWALLRTASLARSFQLAALFGAMVVLALHSGDDTARQVGREMIDQWLMPFLEGREQGVPDEAALDRLAMLVPGMMAAALTAALIISLILGRWWQAILYNPGGFRAEFHELRHGQFAVLTGGVVFILAAVTTTVPLLDNLALVAILVLMFQGLAVCHAFVHRRKLGGVWLVPVYGLLLPFTVPVMSVMAALAILDNVLDLRGRYAPAPQVSDGSDD